MSFIITVMPGFMPGIHVFLHKADIKTWMAGTSPAMTRFFTGRHALNPSTSAMV